MGDEFISQNPRLDRLNQDHIQNDGNVLRTPIVDDLKVHPPLLLFAIVL